jgi:hypothetical protein
MSARNCSKIRKERKRERKVPLGRFRFLQAFAKLALVCDEREKTVENRRGVERVHRIVVAGSKNASKICALVEKKKEMSNQSN